MSVSYNNDIYIYIYIYYLADSIDVWTREPDRKIDSQIGLYPQYFPI